MTPFFIQEGRSTPQLQNYVLYSWLWAPGPCIVVRAHIQHIDFGDNLGALEAVLIRVWSLVTWPPLRHCLIDLDEPCSQVFVECSAFEALVDSTTREAPVPYGHDFDEQVKCGLGGLQPLGQLLRAGPPDEMLAYNQFSGDGNWTQRFTTGT